MENFLFPDEIVLKIFGYLGLGELIQCSKVSRRFNMICKDNSLGGYRSSMLIMKDLTVEDQKCINTFLIARPEMTKVVINSVYWEEGNGKRLSGAMAKRKFLGPKRKRLEKKKKMLKALGASVQVKRYECWMGTLAIGLFYSMPNLLVVKEISPPLKSSRDLSRDDWTKEFIKWK